MPNKYFHNLAITFWKPNLTKANSESHVEGLQFEVTFFKNLKKIESLPLFKSKLKLKLISSGNEITEF